MQVSLWYTILTYKLASTQEPANKKYYHRHHQ